MIAIVPAAGKWPDVALAMTAGQGVTLRLGRHAALLALSLAEAISVRRVAITVVASSRAGVAWTAPSCHTWPPLLLCWRHSRLKCLRRCALSHRIASGERRQAECPALAVGRRVRYNAKLGALVSAIGG